MANNHKLPNNYVYGWMNFDTSYEKDVFGFMMYVLSKKEIKAGYSKEEHFVEFDANDMLALTGKDSKPNKYQDAVDNLMDAKLKFIDPATKDTIFSRVISSARFIDGTTRIRLEIPQTILPKLIAGANNYTLIDLEVLMALRRKYAKRLYELLTMFRTNGQAYFELYDFRGKMGTLDIKTGKILEYPEWKDFKKRCIVDAVNEINDKYSDLKVDYKFHKRGRAVIGVEFFFDFKSYQMRLPFHQLLRDNPDSETGKFVETLKRYGVTAEWQIDFLVKYRRHHWQEIFDEMKKINYDQVMKEPHTCRAILSYVAKCRNKKEIEEWKHENGLV